MRLHEVTDGDRRYVGAICLVIWVGIEQGACGGAEQSGQSGGGPLVYAASEIVIARPRPGGATLGMLVPGLSTVETIESETGAATPLDPPPAPTGCVRFPVAMAVGDLDRDGEVDIAVIDPACGNWIAKGSDGGFQARSWSDFAPDVPPNPFLAIADFDGNGDCDIGTGNPRALTLLTHTGSTWSDSEVAFGAPPNVNGQSVAQLFAAISPGRLLFQRGESFSLVDVASTQQHEPEQINQLVESSTWLKPFVGFDHLTPFGFPGCLQSLLGIGIAPPEAGAVPREVLFLSYDDANTIRVADSGLGAEQVQSLSLVRREDQGDFLVGMIDGASNAPTRFVLARLDACASLTALASAEVEFDWRTPDAPPGYSDPTLAKRGVVLAGTVTSTGATFFHYDGFSLRIFTADESSGAWTVAASRYDIHKARGDHAW